MTMPNGKEFQTTFWTDFTIADAFGNGAIKDTYKRSFKHWKNDFTYLTELVIVLNLKCWQWWERGDEERSKIYSDMYYEADAYALDVIEKEQSEEKAKYYFEMTD